MDPTQQFTNDIDAVLEPGQPVVVAAVRQRGQLGPAVVAGVELLHSPCLGFRLRPEGVHPSRGQDHVTHRAGDRRGAWLG